MSETECIPKNSIQKAVRSVNLAFVKLKEDMQLLLINDSQSYDRLCAVLNTWQIQVKRKLAIILRSCNEGNECSICWKDKSVDASHNDVVDDIDPLFRTTSQG